MKGVILAGGKGTRLYPLTASTNKHLVAIGDVPMIEYPLHTLRKMGINDLSVVTGGEHFSDVQRYLSMVHPSINFSYYCQTNASGIAKALEAAKPVLNGGKIAVVLGDNILEEDFTDAAREFEDSDLGAMLFLKPGREDDLYFTDANGIRRARFGIVEVMGGKVISIEEKPVHPKSNLVSVGLYFYDQTVFDKIKTLKPSSRGEYEITGVSDLYLQEGRLGYHLVNGFWGDAGTFKSRAICEEFVKQNLQAEVLEEMIERENDELLKKNLG
ncbi:MAG: NTP transferase domain-containing protein [Nanoarchaeota archaeon]|nr:NTP transferase domain-containing protein [Nanoarchaeota archaeon]